MGILITIVYFGFSSGHIPLSPSANADAQRLVSLYADGQKRVFATDSSTVQQVLDKSNIKLAPADLVEPKPDTVIPQGFFNINVYRARPVLVQDGYESRQITSAYQSPHLLAEAAGFHVYPEDDYTTQIITDVVGDTAVGVKVSIKRANPLTVHVDGRATSLRTQASTVKEAMSQSDIALGLKDTTSVPLDNAVVPGMDVTITRVSDIETTLTTNLPRAVQTITDPNMLKGQTQIRQEGSDGQKTAMYRIHYRNGVEISRELVQLISSVEPVARVEVVGTKVVFAGSVEYWRPLVMTAAANWGVDPNTMLRIMSCESHGNATSVSSFVVNGEHPTGLFQFLPSTWRANGGTDSNILDGAAQIEIAAKKMAREGTKAWQCK